MDPLKGRLEPQPSSTYSHTDQVTSTVVARSEQKHASYLCGDHNDLEDLHPKLPGYVLPGLVLLTRVHEVEFEVISQALVLDDVLTRGRTGTETQPHHTQHSKHGYLSSFKIIITKRRNELKKNIGVEKQKTEIILLRELS